MERLAQRIEMMNMKSLKIHSASSFYTKKDGSALLISRIVAIVFFAFLSISSLGRINYVLNPNLNQLGKAAWNKNKAKRDSLSFYKKGKERKVQASASFILSIRVELHGDGVTI
jgi:hypothetical protein